MTKFPLCRSASLSTRRSRTVPSQCSQVKSYMPDTSLYFVNSNDQELLVLNKTNYHADWSFLVSGIADDYVACATGIHRQLLVDLTSENRRFNIEHIKVILFHFIV